MVNRESVSAEALSQLIVKGMQERKAKDIVVLDLRDIQKSVADFFVICTGTSDTHLQALHKSIEGIVYKIGGELPWHTEGRQNSEWVLMDYVNVVAHAFLSSKREFYALEELWGDVPTIHVDDESTFDLPSLLSQNS